jgi:RNA polymerase sigma factor (sigma-70 family)
MQDREVVAAIVAGDPRGIAQAYDTYAMPLYSYCRSLLREPEDAADAVQDTFLIATAKLGSLRDPGKLRSWLYAVARNECYRRLRSGEATSALDEAVDMTAESLDVASAVERAELHQLVRDAINGLNPGERDVIELSLVQGLDNDELADALGVSRNHAHALQSRARSQLERSLGALIVARTGRDECTALDALLAGWDGRMTPLLRKRVSRHIDQCGICGERKRRELTPALFAGALPLVALMPGFRERVLEMATANTPAELAHRADAVLRAGQLGPDGFPKPVSPPGPVGWHKVIRHSHALAASAATAAAAAVIAVLMIGGGAPSHVPGAGARGSAGPGVVANSHGGPSGRDAAPGAGGSGLTPGGRSDGATAPALAVGPGSHAAPGGSATSSSGSSSSGPTSPASTVSSSSATSSSAPAAQGTLTVSLSRLVLAAVSGHGVGTFTLTAKGGPVSYTISAPAGLTVSPASGSLAAGASATITVTSASLISLDEQLTVNPGGYTVTVVLNISL